ncbi:hypothetical protein LDENG_00057670 [Lucifuga dentata]|nr:hypothetical protein LDENG_00057670 [Lucifuga dentata]
MGCEAWTIRVFQFSEGRGFRIKMYLSSLLICLCLGALIEDCDGSTEWCYSGCNHSPSHWSSIASSSCGEKKQSPINIVTNNVVTDANLHKFTLVNFSSQHVLKSLTYNGHTVKCMLEENMVEVGGGGLNGTYSSIQFHFHWGDTEHHPGSEHQTDGHKYPMEMHIVSLKKGLTVDQAKADPQGIAVLGFFITETENSTTSEPWNIFTSYLKNITNIGSTVNITHNISIDDLIGNVDLTKFYRYMGSLTTPTCNEAVIWTIFQEPIKVGKNLSQLFPMKTGVSNVFRPVQALNGRHVFASPAVSLPSSNHTWCYNDHCRFDPAHWHLLPQSHCGEKSQSPINIETENTVENKDLNEFTFTMFDDKHSIKYITNTGHTVKCDVKEGLEISGGGLGYVYSTLQFHFHWGSTLDDSKGSEHMVDSKQYPMEMHIVNRRKDLTLEKALETPNGLAVLGFFIEVDESKMKSSGGSEHSEHQEEETSSNSGPWEKVTSYLSSVSNTSNKVEVHAEISIDDLLGDVNRISYYRYNGSLTTPSCNEVVVWTVFKNPIKLDKNLIKKFTTQVGYNGVYRPVQALSARKVYTTAASCAPGPRILVLLVACFWAFSL